MNNLRIKTLRKELDVAQLGDVLLDLTQEQRRKGRRPRRVKRVMKALRRARNDRETA